MGRYGGRMRGGQNRLSDRFVVKVQISLRALDAKGKRADQRILVYNQDKSIYYESKLEDDVKELMNKRPKAYFYAKMRGSDLVLEGEAPGQDW